MCSGVAVHGHALRIALRNRVSGLFSIQKHGENPRASIFFLNLGLRELWLLALCSDILPFATAEPVARTLDETETPCPVTTATMIPH